MHMKARKTQIEGLVDNFQCIKRAMGYSPGKDGTAPKVTGSQWTVLVLLSRKPDLSIKEVAAFMSISSSAATQLVESLVQAKHIIRAEDTTDRRAVSLNLSRNMADKIVLMKKDAVERLMKVYSVLTDEELDRYVELNNKIAKNLSQ
ncbi:MAG: DNA-binding transcriptional regulator, MarR family [Candidatus Kaiserbacteria bacterium]|nr:DNA-binding transcriptional regulator, MarR family [Candidatus Kaiserbacteria bacterium]